MSSAANHDKNTKDQNGDEKEPKAKRKRIANPRAVKVGGGAAEADTRSEGGEDSTPAAGG